MKKGICLLSMIPVMENASDKSQMVNQLLFGDRVQLVDMFDRWMMIENEEDGSEGWVDSQQIFTLQADSPLMEKPLNDFYLADAVTIARHKGKPVYLTLGSRLPAWNGQQMNVDGNIFTFDTPPKLYTGKKNAAQLAEIAKQFLGSPWFLGGRSIFGMDCSGFTQIVFKIAGIKLPRSSSNQALQGETVNFIHESRKGDLAFFEDDEGKIVHVGILLGESKIIHAYGRVQIDTIDHEGIYNETLRKYTHKLRIIKRMQLTMENGVR